MIKEDLAKTCCNSYIKLVIMDYDMPVMNGAESTCKILELKSQQNIAIYKQALFE